MSYSQYIYLESNAEDWLINAAIQGDAVAVQEVLQHKKMSAVTIKDAAWTAAYHGHDAVCDVLLPYAGAKKGMVCGRLARMVDDGNVVKVIEAMRDGGDVFQHSHDALRRPVFNDDFPMVRFLLDKGLDPNKTFSAFDVQKMELGVHREGAVSSDMFNIVERAREAYQNETFDIEEICPITEVPTCHSFDVKGLRKIYGTPMTAWLMKAVMNEDKVGVETVVSEGRYRQDDVADAVWQAGYLGYDDIADYMIDVCPDDCDVVDKYNGRIMCHLNEGDLAKATKVAAESGGDLFQDNHAALQDALIEDDLDYAARLISAGFNPLIAFSDEDIAEYEEVRHEVTGLSSEALDWIIQTRLTYLDDVHLGPIGDEARYDIALLKGDGFNLGFRVPGL